MHGTGDDRPGSNGTVEMTPAEQLAARESRTQVGRSLRGHVKVWDCRLREIRTALGLTQTQVAVSCGSTSWAVSRIEDGCDPSLKVALALAAFFGRPVAELWRPLEIEKDS
jgi:DNA-binding XRE family transcriptional regulator